MQSTLIYSIKNELNLLLAKHDDNAVHCHIIAANVGIVLDKPPPVPPLPEVATEATDIAVVTRKIVGSMEERAQVLSDNPGCEVIVQLKTKALYDAFRQENAGVQCEYTGSKCTSVECAGIHQTYADMMQEEGGNLMADLLRVQRPKKAVGMHDDATLVAKLCSFVTGLPVVKKNEKYQCETKKNKKGFMYTSLCEATSLTWMDNEPAVMRWFTEKHAGSTSNTKRQHADLIVALYASLPAYTPAQQQRLGRYRHLFHQFKDSEIVEQENKTPSESDIKNTPTAEEVAGVEKSGSALAQAVTAFSKEWHGRSQNFVVYTTCRINGVLFQFKSEGGRKEEQFMGWVVEQVDGSRIHEDGYLRDENSIVIHQNADKSYVIENVQARYKTLETYGRQVGLFSPELTKKTMDWLGECDDAETLFGVKDTRQVKEMFTKIFSQCGKEVTPALLRRVYSTTPEMRAALRLLTQTAAIENHSFLQQCGVFYSGRSL